MLRLDSGYIKVMNTTYLTATLVWETKNHAFGIRVWPYSELVQHMINYEVLTQPNEIWDKSTVVPKLLKEFKVLETDIRTWVLSDFTPEHARDWGVAQDAIREINKEYRRAEARIKMTDTAKPATVAETQNFESQREVQKLVLKCMSCHINPATNNTNYCNACAWRPSPGGTAFFVGD